MSRFGPESSFYSTLSLIADVVIINVLMVLTAFPVVTIGASMRAGHVVIHELLHDRGSNPVRLYVSAFRSHWTTSTLAAIIALALLAFGAWELALVDSLAGSGAVGAGLRVAILSGMLMVGGIWSWMSYGEAREPLAFRASLTRAVIATVSQLGTTLVALATIVIPALAIATGVVPVGLVAFVYLSFGWGFSLYLFQLGLSLSARR